MKHNFRGWTTVFGFTFRQSTKGFAYKLVTALISLLIIAIFILMNILVAKPEDKVEISQIKKIFILDNSGLQPTDFRAITPQLSEEQFKHIEIINVANQTREEVINTASKDSTETIAVIISTSDSGYMLEGVIPPGSTISRAEASDIIDTLQSGFETSKLMQSGLSMEQLTTLMKPSIISYSAIGENNNETAYLIKVIAPMFFALVIYMMMQLYGQTLCKAVSTEKTSKLVETLLTSVHPYALITGKVLAVTSTAVLQCVTWIIAAVIGLYGGNYVAHSMYPEYENSAITIINFVKDNIGETALSLPAVILAILVLSVGILFYFIIASLSGSIASKPEDTASTQSLFVFPLLISWLICYIAPVSGNEGVLRVARYVPFTSPLCVPVDLMTGTMGILEGCIAFAVLSIVCLLLVILSGRLYKGMILYNGQSLSLKKIGNILKANK